MGYRVPMRALQLVADTLRVLLRTARFVVGLPRWVLDLDQYSEPNGPRAELSRIWAGIEDDLHAKMRDASHSETALNA